MESLTPESLIYFLHRKSTCMYGNHAKYGSHIGITVTSEQVQNWCVANRTTYAPFCVLRRSL